MPIFSYRAVDAAGRRTRGQLSGATAAAVSRELETRGLLLLDLQEARDALLSYATLIGDEKPLASVSTRIADYSVRLGEPALAVRWFDRAIDEAGPSTSLQVKLADAALRAGDVARAHQVVDEGLAAEPGNPSLLQLKQRLPR